MGSAAAEPPSGPRRAKGGGVVGRGGLKTYPAQAITPGADGGSGRSPWGGGRALSRRAQTALAADGDPVILGASNDEDHTTTIINHGIHLSTNGLEATSGDSGTGLVGRGGPNSGAGVEAHGGGPNGHGLVANTLGNGIAVVGVSGGTNGIGVLGEGSGTAAGVDGGSDLGPGVRGRGRLGGATGVLGEGGPSDGTGVRGTGGGTGTGVHGISNDPNGRAAVAANKAGGVGLEVIGPAVFDRSGLATAPAGSRSVNVTGVPLTASSLVFWHWSRTLVRVPCGTQCPTRSRARSKSP